ncbi:chitosanase [Bifidobacterium amazonense]|uniref:Chitosanase n=1 Tax=Bifidobacterium amazonense TaxID=2809027 RepID=A0ABS9VVB8_9BIFI|nr:chitosanase [Bifidobacterium amazonense]MCH9275891.1 chitosanase [Bifidobacterium amazonense]
MNDTTPSTQGNIPASMPARVGMLATASIAVIVALSGAWCSASQSAMRLHNVRVAASPVPTQSPHSADERTIAAGDLRKIVFALVSSAENSTTDYSRTYSYIEDIGDGRGYTGGIVGFTSGTGDMLDVVRRYTRIEPDNRLARFLPALADANGTDTHKGLGDGFTAAWKRAARDRKFIEAQNNIVHEQYLDPAVRYARKDGLSPLGQYIYYDALVVHGPGSADDGSSFQAIRAAAMQTATTPSRGGDEATYLRAFLDARTPVMQSEEAHRDLSRLQTQLGFINDGNFRLTLPLHWTMYGDRYELTPAMLRRLP